MPWKAKQEVLVLFFFSLTRVCTMETTTPRRNPGYATAFDQVLQKTNDEKILVLATAVV